MTEFDITVCNVDASTNATSTSTNGNGNGNGITTNVVQHAYSEAFMRGKPSEALRAVQGRLSTARGIMNDLAEYFHERAAAEETYAKALQKCLKKPIFTNRCLSSSGIFGNVFESLMKEVNKLTEMHHILSKRFLDELETPLRLLPLKNEWAKLKIHDTSLERNIKDHNLLLEKIEKYSKRMDSGRNIDQKRTKIAEISRSLDDSRMEWETEAPIVFDQYQIIDQMRLEALKEMIVKFETMQSDYAQSIMSITEQTMQLVLNIDPKKDIEEFCSSHTMKMMMNEGDENNHEFSHVNIPSDIRQRSISIEGGGQSTYSSISHSNSGLRSAFGLFRSKTRASEKSHNISKSLYSGSKTSLSVSDQGMSQGHGQKQEQQQEQQQQEQQQQQPPLVTPLLNKDMEIIENTDKITSPVSFPVLAPIQIDSEGFSIPPPDRKPWENINGEQDNENDNNEGNENDNENDNENNESIDDGEGFEKSSKPIKMEILDKSIIEHNKDVENALSRVQNTLQSKNTINRRKSGMRRRRDTKKSLQSKSSFIQEQEREQEERDNLNQENSPSLPTQVTFSSETISDSGSIGSILSSFPNYSANTLLTDSAISSTMTSSPSYVVNSSSPSSTIESSNIMSPSSSMINLRIPLSINITETVNVLQRNGEASKVFITGEVGVTLMGNLSLHKEVIDIPKAHLKFNEYHLLEKAAPNTNYLNAIEGNKVGEYFLDLGLLALSGNNTKPIIILKYQVRTFREKLDEMVPLIIYPAWRCEPQQTSLMINYHLNEKCKMSYTTGLSNVTFAVGIEHGENVQSKPGAIWSRESGKLAWNIGSLSNIDQDNSEKTDIIETKKVSGKLLARIKTSSSGEPGKIVVHWKSGMIMSGLNIESQSDQVDIMKVNYISQSGKYISL